MKRVTNLENCRIETFGISSEQHEMVVEMVKSDKEKNGNYTLDETDTEVANVWIADAHSEGDTDYAEFLREAIANGADLYVLTDHVGEFAQPLGDVVVYK